MARVHQQPDELDDPEYSAQPRRSESHLEPQRQRSENLDENTMDENEGSYHLQPQLQRGSAATLSRSVSSLWTSTLKRTVGETETGSIIVNNRYLLLGQINALGHRKYNLNTCNAVIGGVSLVVLMVHLELRMRENEDEGVGQACDILRGVELALTVALGLSSALFQLTHHQILVVIGAGYLGGHEWRSFWGFALLETLVLFVGVLPPGIESSVSIALTPAAYDENVEEVIRHIDCYCLCQMICRIPLLVKWVSVAWLAHVKSPAVLSWQHGVDVDSQFRMKYLLTKKPLTFVSLTLLLVWICGSFALHILDPAYPTLWSAIYDSWILLLDAPPRTPITILGGIIVMLMSFYGALSVAVVTAALHSAAELTPDEVWLVRTLEKQEELRKRERAAVALMQATIRLWIAKHTKRHQVQGGNRPEGSRTNILEQSSQKRLVSNDELARLKGVQQDAAMVFKHARHRLSHLTHVHNMAVLHDSVDALRIDQQRLASKMDAVVRASANTAKAVQALVQRQEAEAASSEPPRRME